jgi:hypothetical protein
MPKGLGGSEFEKNLSGAEKGVSMVGSEPDRLLKVGERLGLLVCRHEHPPQGQMGVGVLGMSLDPSFGKLNRLWPIAPLAGFPDGDLFGTQIGEGTLVSQVTIGHIGVSG